MILKKGFFSFKSKFMGVIPVPRQDVPIEDIINFKKNNGTALNQFREIIDRVQTEVSEAENRQELKRIITQNQERIEVERDKLKKAMRSSNIKTVTASLKSLIDIKKPELLGQIAPWAGAAIALNNPLAIVPGLIYTSLTLINNRNEQRAQMSTSPYSYLYYAEESSII
jgi:hypothetical protein